MTAPLLTIHGSTSWLTLPQLTLAAGDLCMLFGESGAGKSRLLRALADLDPNNLELSLGQQTRQEIAAHQWRQRLQYLPAEPVWWTESAGEMVNDHWTAQAEALGLAAELLTAPISQLSTGERQRAALLRALSVEPDILLLDEPTAALDQNATEKVEALLNKWRQGGNRAILWVSHNPDQRQRLASQQWQLENGVLQCQ